MKRAGVAARYPIQQRYVLGSDWALAREYVPGCTELPPFYERDTWILQLRSALESRFLAGERQQFVREECKHKGLSKRAAHEVMRRIVRVDNYVLTKGWERE